MSTWKIAAVQMDCILGEPVRNRDAMLASLREAAGQGARLAIFPECALTGYCFTSKAEAMPFAEPIPGPSTLAFIDACRELGIYAIVGMLELAGDHLYNVAVLLGPNGVVAVYRKVHLPFLGVDRFTTPGNRPFAVHAIGDLRVGMAICYDGSFPEVARCLMLRGADLIALPTNWPTGAFKSAQILVPARALENHVFYAAVNRVGTEAGFRFIGFSQIVNPYGEVKAVARSEGPEILYADIDPALARNKHLVNIPGEYEIHRTRDRRPDLYSPVAQPLDATT